MKRGYYPALAALVLIAAPVAWADSNSNSNNNTNNATRVPASERSKNIKFEDDVVEGMNKNPMDSAENLGRHDQQNAAHLYHKPTDFKDAVQQTVHEMGKSQ